MLRVFVAFMVMSLCSLSTAMTTTIGSTHSKITHVIYITIDGSRWQDIFNDHSYFQKTWMKHAKHAIFYGAPDGETTMEVASIPISLPSYQSQMGGAVQSCGGNECGRIQQVTLLENIMHQLHVDKKEVAVFASWNEIALASESVLDTVYVNAGNAPANDPITEHPDEVMLRLNRAQDRDNPGGGDRYDTYTFAHAFHYLKKYQPRFLWISLNDTDEMAHENNLPKYHEALVFADDAIDQVITTLKQLHLMKETLVIVTTDHGRGDGEYWTTHGIEHPESKRTWAFVINGELTSTSKDNNFTHYSTLSIRPTIEAALGLQ
jgi:predicted AlkP superfamily pyrophosphatase or phosphodiesterase